MSRDAALALLQQDPYPSQADLEQDLEFLSKKMGWTRAPARRLYRQAPQAARVLSQRTVGCETLSKALRTVKSDPSPRQTLKLAL